MVTIPRTGAATASLLAGGLSLTLLALAGLDGCANVAPPPGGPPDTTPPLLIAVEPDSYSVVSGFKDEVRFEFDESISERNVPLAVTLYPFEARPRVGNGKRDVKVRPRAGWVADRIYHMRIEPVIQDLFNNAIDGPIHYVFSTGAPITENRVEGTVFDRITGRPLVLGRLDMVQLPDTLRYGIVADSQGVFGLGALPVGDYFAIGYDDVNNNNRADDFDRSDTISVSLGATDTLSLEFRVFRHDTLGPQLFELRSIDSLTVELGFDGYLDPEASLSTANIEMFAVADSAPIALDAVLHAWQYTAWRDSVARARQAAADTLESETPADPGTLGEAAARDTSAVQAPVPERAPGAEQEPGPEQEEEAPAILPDRRIYVIAAAPIPPDTIVVRAQGILNLSGLEGGGERTYEQPAREPEPEEPEPPPEPPPQPPG
ncbi:MAG: hypothetical protein JSV41_13295 [Gemmatimonadota bacterium]|nr:MAG: hypothetical protein JSV41_13295 [Gemmatimonadota bacterium]